MKTWNNIVILNLLVHFTAGCTFSSVGGGIYKENGNETKSISECMGHCLSKTTDGKHCIKFSSDMAKVCRKYLAD